jgi:hypothetical protein
VYACCCPLAAGCKGVRSVAAAANVLLLTHRSYSLFAGVPGGARHDRSVPDRNGRGRAPHHRAVLPAVALPAVSSLSLSFRGHHRQLMRSVRDVYFELRRLNLMFLAVGFMVVLLAGESRPAVGSAVLALCLIACTAEQEGSRARNH